MRRDHGVAVTELRCIFHLDTNSGQLLNKIATHKAGVPRGTTSHENDIVGIKQLLLILGDAAETHCVGFGVQTATHGVAHDGRLLVDFLHHEVVEASFFDAVEVHLQLLDVRYSLHILNGLNVQFLAQFDFHNLLILKVYHLLRATHDRRGIRGDVILALADADDHGTSLSGCNQLVGVIFLHDDDGIGTHHMVQGDTYRLKQIHMLAKLHVFDEVGKYFRVGRRFKSEATLFQFLAKAQIVLDDAIVNQGNVARL